MRKPDGLVTITTDDLPHKLYPLGLRDLYGVGARMEARLRAHQIDTVEHLCAASPELLREIWGGIEGERFHASLHGLPTHARTTTCRSVSHSHILPPELRHENGARSVLHRPHAKGGHAPALDEPPCRHDGCFHPFNGGIRGLE